MTRKLTLLTAIPIFVLSFIGSYNKTPEVRLTSKNYEAIDLSKKKMEAWFTVTYCNPTQDEWEWNAEFDLETDVDPQYIDFYLVEVRRTDYEWNGTNWTYTTGNWQTWGEVSTRHYSIDGENGCKPNQNYRYYTWEVKGTMSFYFGPPHGPQSVGTGIMYLPTCCASVCAPGGSGCY